MPQSFLVIPVAAAAFFGLFTPLLFIFLNHDTGIRHIRLILAIQRTFGRQGCGEKSTKLTSIEDTPSFNMVLNKYFADLDEMGSYITQKGTNKSKSNNPETINNVDYDGTPFRKSFFETRSNYHLIATSTPYCLIVAFFFFIILTPHLLRYTDTGDLGAWLKAALMTLYPTADAQGNPYQTYAAASPFTTILTGSGTGSCGQISVLFSVITFSFLGSYIFTLAYLLRAVSQFDLDGRLFFQSFRQILGSVVGATVVWRLGVATDISCSKPGPEIWSAFAFVIGFMPDGGIRYLLTSLSSTDFFKGVTRFYKASDDRFTDITKSIPLDVIDGIDTYTRFRLELNGIHEVQNLATANAILLHIETPYGLYQTIDWVAQAQLCTIVGPERFLAFRQFNIRTIFDLERATLSLRSTSQFRRIIGALLTSPTSTMVDLQKLCGSKYYTFKSAAGPQPAAADPAPAAPPLDTLEAFWIWARDLIGQSAKVRQIYRERTTDAPPIAAEHPHAACTCSGCDKCEQILARLALSCFSPDPAPAGADISTFKTTCGPSAVLKIWEIDDPDGTIKHIVRVIVDDLHVQRLRQIWESISRQLEADSLTLDDSEDAIYG